MTPRIGHRIDVKIPWNQVVKNQRKTMSNRGVRSAKTAKRQGIYLENWKVTSWRGVARARCTGNFHVSARCITQDSTAVPSGPLHSRDDGSTRDTLPSESSVSTIANVPDSSGSVLRPLSSK